MRPIPVEDASALGPNERATLRAIAERLIPSDEFGPGAREANVARYIELALATEYRSHLQAYRRGLESTDTYARSLHGVAFADLTPADQDDVLSHIERGRAANRGGPPAWFFELVLQHSREGMFGDPAWGGNAGLVGWELIGYPGPKYSWSRDEQQISSVLPAGADGSARRKAARNSYKGEQRGQETG